MSRTQALLAPLVPLYAAASGAKNFAYDHRWIQPKHLTWPVISVGNLSVGGAGKTPVVIRLAQMLTDRGHHVDMLSRGYGRTASDTARVDPEGSAARYGDEPILISRSANVPVYVGSDRFAAGTLAEHDHPGPGIHLLDDGFQHRRLARDVDIVVVHSSDLNERLLPAGRLREPLTALNRASILILREEDRHLEPELQRLNPAVSIWIQQRRLAIPPLKQSIAFCAIAHPDEFFSVLRSHSDKIGATSAFRDHHVYNDADLDRLLELRDQNWAEAFITTEKDWVRLSPEQRTRLAPLITARLEVVFENEPALIAQLLSLIMRK